VKARFCVHVVAGLSSLATLIFVNMVVSLWAMVGWESTWREWRDIHVIFYIFCVLCHRVCSI